MNYRSFEFDTHKKEKKPPIMNAEIITACHYKKLVLSNKAETRKLIVTTPKIIPSAQILSTFAVDIIQVDLIFHVIGLHPISTMVSLKLA